MIQTHLFAKKRHHLLVKRSAEEPTDVLDALHRIVIEYQLDGRGIVEVDQEGHLPVPVPLVELGLGNICKAFDVGSQSVDVLFEVRVIHPTGVHMLVEQLGERGVAVIEILCGKRLR